MTEVVVWDERDDYTACTWRSTLMALVAHGFTAFPLGAYTVAEAQAFRGGDTRLNFSGPVERAAARYGVNVISPTPFTQEGLRAALSVRGKAFAVAGRTANFPAGHPIRRWDPVFSGFHAVCVIPLGNGQVRWLDPLAYTGFAGDTVSISDVTDVFAAGNYPNDARYLPMALEHDVDLKGTIIEWINNRQTTVTYATGLGLADDPTLGTRQNLAVLAAGTAFTPIAKVRGVSFLGSDAWYCGPITGTPPKIGYLPVAGCGPMVPIETVEVPGPTVTVEVPGPTVEVPAPAIPAPTDVASAKTVLLAAGIDIDGAKAELIKQTTNLNTVAKARSAAVTNKNAARMKLGG